MSLDRVYSLSKLYQEPKNYKRNKNNILLAITIFNTKQSIKNNNYSNTYDAKNPQEIIHHTFLSVSSLFCVQYLKLLNKYPM
mmetsp:Transcript_64256/g.71811  ORF Transcript_64256/g.71811 Transcript_64256/m.71811 type:complete len:82 (+) Transcript_64256:880-1125(+)